MNILLDNNADPNMTVESGRISPLGLAIREKHRDIEVLLRKYGAC